MKFPSLIYTFFCFAIPLTGFTQSVSPDMSFGKKGKFYFSNGRYNDVKDVIITDDKSVLILVESGMLDSLRDRDVILLKLTPKGKPDETFGEGGKVQFDYDGMNISRAGEMKLLPGGKILIAGDGSKFSAPDSNLSCLAKFLPDGKPDSSFGNSGTITFNFHKVSYLTSLCKNDSSVLVAGSYNQPVRSHTDIFPVIGKFDEDGKADSSFGKTGKIWIDFNFEIFSFASTKHTAGGEIMDILVQDDGKILVCGGFIFRYTYEGFIARFNPDGTLDKSFNSKGYFRHDFTPGKFNLIKRMALYGSNTLIFGAASQTDFDSDFYLGTLDLTNFSFSVTLVDFKGKHDMLEDISIEGNELVLTGRSVLPENAPLRHQSDVTAIAVIPDISKINEFEISTVALSKKFQHGLVAHDVSQDKIVTAGFEFTSNIFVKDVIVARFTKKKTKK